MEKGPIYRIGTFLIILGGLLVIIFFGSLASGDSAPVYLLLGLIAFFLGYSLHRRKTEQTEQPDNSSRFQTARKYRDRYQKKSDVKQNKDNQNK